MSSQLRKPDRRHRSGHDITDFADDLSWLLLLFITPHRMHESFYTWQEGNRTLLRVFRSTIHLHHEVKGEETHLNFPLTENPESTSFVLHDVKGVGW